MATSRQDTAVGRYFRRWWLGARLLVAFWLAWFIAVLPILVGQLAVGEVGTAALGVASCLYAVLVLPVVFAATLWPLPTEAPRRGDRGQ